MRPDEKNALLYERAMNAIKELYSDRGVSKEKTKENLEIMVDEIYVMMEGLQLKC